MAGVHRNVRVRRHGGRSSPDGHFIDYYNFQRPHQGIDGLVPANRFFGGAASEVLTTLRKCVAANALELARNGVPKAQFYVTGRIGERGFSVHSEGERMFLKREGHERTEVDLTAPENVAVPLVSVASDQPAALPLPVCPDGSPPCDVPPEGKCRVRRPWMRDCVVWTRRSLADNQSRKVTRREAMTTNHDDAVLAECHAHRRRSGGVGGRPPEPKEPISRDAQRFATGILEVLAGVRTPTDAAAAMGISVPRYYLWERGTRSTGGARGGC